MLLGVCEEQQARGLLYRRVQFGKQVLTRRILEERQVGVSGRLQFWYASTLCPPNHS
jgi:hypothetical protein